MTDAPDAIRSDLRAILLNLFRDARRLVGDESSRDARQILAYAEARVMTLVEKAAADA